MSDELDPYQSCHIVVAEIRRCIGDDQLMQAHRKLDWLDVALGDLASESAFAEAEVARLRAAVAHARAVRLRQLDATCPDCEPGCTHGAEADTILIALGTGGPTR